MESTMPIHRFHGSHHRAGPSGAVKACAVQGANGRYSGSVHTLECCGLDAAFAKPRHAGRNAGAEMHPRPRADALIVIEFLPVLNDQIPV